MIAGFQADSGSDPLPELPATSANARKTMHSNPKIQVENLTKVYGDERPAAFNWLKPRENATSSRIAALSGVSLDVNQGEIVVLMGLSGSGKSTLVRSINRLVTPTSGRILIDGEDIVGATEDRLRELRLTKVSMVFQHYGLFPHRTVAENVEYGLKMKRVGPGLRRSRALEVLDMVGLANWAEHKPSSLSGGMQQRVGLARALATDAEILLMDEPFSALDPLTRREMQDKLLELRKRLNRTIVFVTHDVNEALKLGDRVAVLRDGTLAQFGAPHELLSQPADDYVRALMQDANPMQVLKASMLSRQAPSLTLGRNLTADVLRSLKDRDARRIFVLGPLGEPVGFFEQAQFERLDRLQDGDAGQFMCTKFRAVYGSTPIGDFANSCVQEEVVAVVDEMGRFQGVVEPLDVAATMKRAALSSDVRREPKQT